MSYSQIRSLLVKTINDHVKKNKKYPISVLVGSTTIPNVVGARAYISRQADGSDPYTDVVISTKDGKEIEVSVRGNIPPEVTQRGISTIIPSLPSQFLNEARDQLIKSGLQPGKVVPDIYGTISRQNTLKLTKGSRGVGGPIDYIYVGPRDVRYSFDETNSTLTFRGNLIDVATYARSHPLFLHLISEAPDARFDPEMRYMNMPKIYGKSSTMGDRPIYVVLTTNYPKTAFLVKT